MDHYLEITLLPDPEFTQPFLMGALYNKLHKALVSLNANNIGVSFPGYSVKPKGLGNKLRVHGDKLSLSQLQQTSWLKGMADHMDLEGPKLVPDEANHTMVKRKQFKTNVERLRRRRMKRKNETYEQATQAIPYTVERKPDLPFLMVRSGSTQQSFCLFIDQANVDACSTDGGFNTYGLSQGATVPWF